MGLEGIVSKRLGSRYRSGRSPDWLKFSLLTSSNSFRSTAVVILETIMTRGSGARLTDLAEHADAWNGEVIAQVYLHGRDRPEAKRPVESLSHNA